MHKFVDEERGVSDIVVINMVFLHVPVILVDDESVLAQSLDWFDHVAFEGETDGGKSYIFEMLNEGSVTGHDGLDCLVSSAVVVAVVCVGLFELVPIEEVIQEYLREPGTVRIELTNGRLECIEEVVVDGVNLLNVAEKVLVHLRVSEKGTRGDHHLLDDELEIFAVCAFGLQQFHSGEDLLLLSLEEFGEAATGSIASPMALNCQSSKRLFIPLLALHN